MAANFDRRRVQAPEDSHPPIYANSEAGPSRRTDRASDELRPIYSKTGLVTQANGSAYIEASGVKIACSAFGPRPRQPPYTPHGTLNVQVKFAPFANRVRRAPLRDTEPVNHAALLTQLLLPALRLHLLPKLCVDVHVYVLEADSDAAVLSAGLSAACAALADAGIEMGGLVVGSVVALDTEGGQETMLVDPTGAELKKSACTVTLGAMPALERVTDVHLTGEADLDVACKMIEAALSGAKGTHAAIAGALIEAAQ